MKDATTRDNSSEHLLVDYYTAALASLHHSAQIRTGSSIELTKCMQSRDNAGELSVRGVSSTGGELSSTSVLDETGTTTNTFGGRNSYVHFGNQSLH